MPHKWFGSDQFAKGQAPLIIVQHQGSEYVVKPMPGSGIAGYSDTDPDAAIADGLSKLTSARSWQEMIALRGTFYDLDDAIAVPDYTILDARGTSLRWKTGSTVHGIVNSDFTGGNTDIDIILGKLDGRYQGKDYDMIHLEKALLNCNVLGGWIYRAGYTTPDSANGGHGIYLKDCWGLHNIGTYYNSCYKSAEVAGTTGLQVYLDGIVCRRFAGGCPGGYDHHILVNYHGVTIQDSIIELTLTAAKDGIHAEGDELLHYFDVIHNSFESITGTPIKIVGGTTKCDLARIKHNYVQITSASQVCIDIDKVIEAEAEENYLSQSGGSRIGIQTSANTEQLHLGRNFGDLGTLVSHSINAATKLRDLNYGYSCMFGTLLTWTDMPAALTELGGFDRYRSRLNLQDYEQARIVARIITGGATNAELRGQYSTDESTWAYLDGSSGPGVNINSAGCKTSSWVNIPTAAKADVYLRIVGINGDGAADPAIGIISLQFR